MQVDLNFVNVMFHKYLSRLKGLLFFVIGQKTIFSTPDTKLIFKYQIEKEEIKIDYNGRYYAGNDDNVD